MSLPFVYMSLVIVPNLVGKAKKGSSLPPYWHTIPLRGDERWIATIREFEDSIRGRHFEDHGDSRGTRGRCPKSLSLAIAG